MIDRVKYLHQEVVSVSPRVDRFISEDGKSEVYWGVGHIRVYEKVSNLHINDGGIIVYCGLRDKKLYVVDNGVESCMGPAFWWPPKGKYIHLCEQVRDHQLLVEVPKKRRLLRAREIGKKGLHWTEEVLVWGIAILIELYHRTKGTH